MISAHRTRVQVKPADKRYSTVRNDYELHFNDKWVHPFPLIASVPLVCPSYINRKTKPTIDFVDATPPLYSPLLRWRWS